MREINGKLIVIGDVHFGVKRFSIPFLRNTIAFFTEQVFPYMEENGITEIFQLGDLFDNRTTSDINFNHVLREEFFEVLVEKGFTLHSLVGNHDIFFRESREVTLVKMFRDLYPENFILYEDREEVLINGNRTYVVPWITKDESLEKSEIEGMHTILGHFEIRNFAMVRGHIDTSSELDEGFFEKGTKVKNVFSGHYHIKSTSRMVKYLGTPVWINWNDFCEEKGFYVWDEFDGLEFIDNVISKKFVKVKYNDEQDDERHIEVEGLFKTRKMYTAEEFKQILPMLERHEVKFLINKAQTREFDEILYTMKEAKIQPTAVIDNQEISKIIGADYLTNFEDNENIEIENTRQLIIDTVTEHKIELLPMMLDILSEVDSHKDKEV